MFLYILFIPGVVFKYFLYKYSKKLETLRMMSVFGMLYKEFRSKAYFFEIIRLFLGIFTLMFFLVL